VNLFYQTKNLLYYEFIRFEGCLKMENVFPDEKGIKAELVSHKIVFGVVDHLKRLFWQ